MSRTVTTAFRRELQERDGGDPLLALLTITHPALSGPFRATTDSVDTVSNGNTFIPYAFDITLPDEKVSGLPEAKLVIDNVDRVILAKIRELSGGGAPGILVQIVLASDPNDVNVEFTDMELTSVEYDLMRITGRISQSPILDAPFPYDRFTPEIFPALFK
jgi:hypothetical protein